MSKIKIKRLASKKKRPRGADARQATPGQMLEHSMRRQRKISELREKAVELKEQVAKSKASEEEEK